MRTRLLNKILTIWLILLMAALMTVLCLSTQSIAVRADTNILTGGTASADCTLSSYVASNAVDGSLATFWNSCQHAFPFWWKYDLGAGNEKIVNSFKIYPYWDSVGGYTKDITLAGSLDNTNWTTIFSVTLPNATGWDSYSVSNTNPYRYYKINELNSYRTDDPYGLIIEIEMYGTSPTSTPTNTPTDTPTNTLTPSNTPTNTLTPSNTPTITLTPSDTPTITLTPSNTPTITLTPSYTPTITLTPSNTSAITNTPTDTPTITLTPSDTSTITPTPTISLTPTITNTPTITLTPTITPTLPFDPTEYYQQYADLADNNLLLIYIIGGVFGILILAAMAGSLVWLINKRK